MTKISFVIPAYNEEHYIRLCLNSILKDVGSRTDTEIIVVDNNSTDDTVKIVSEYPNVKLVTESRRGANAARKRGFAEAKGELIAFPDADTIMPKGWIARAEKEFRDPTIVCVSGPFIYYDLPRHIRLLVRVFYMLTYLFYLAGKAFLGGSVTVQGGNYMVRRTALEKIGGPDASISFYGDDTDLALKLNKVGVVKYFYKMNILTSGRRLAKEGPWTMGWRYALNNFWMILFHKPWTKTATEVRFENGQTVYSPENSKKEWLIASLFMLTVIVVLGGAIYLIYYLITAGIIKV